MMDGFRVSPTDGVVEDPIASKRHLEEFLDVVEELLDADGSEKLTLLDFLSKRSSLITVRRYALIQRDLDVVDVLSETLLESLEAVRNGIDDSLHLRVAQGVLGVLESLVGSEGTADTSDGISKRNATIVLRHPSKPLRAVSDLLGVVCAIASETQAGQRKGLARACDLLNHASGLVSHLTANAGWSLDALQGLGTYDKAKGLSSGQSMDDVVGMVLQIVTGELILLSGMDGNQPHRLFETFEKVLQLWLQTASTAVVSPVLWLLLGAVLRCQLPGALANTSASTTTVKWMLSQGELYLKGRSLTGQEIQRALERRGNSWVSIISMLTTSLQKARVLPQPASTFVKQNVADLFAFYVNVRGNHTHLHSPPAAASLSMKQMRASPTAYCSIPTNLQDCMHRVKSLLTVHFVSDVNDLAAHIADVLRNLAILKLPHCSIGDELISLQKDFNWAIHHEERCSLYPSPMSKFGVFSMEDLHACVVFALDVFSKYCLLAAGAGKSLAPSLQLPAAQPSAAPTSPAAGILRLGVAIVCTEDACMESHECASAGSEHEILNESVDGKMTALLLDIAKRCQDQLLIPFFREPMRWKLFPAVLLKEVKSARLKEASNSSKLDCGGILPAAASPLSLLPSLRPPTRSNIAREPMKASSESSLALSPRLSGSSEILGGTSAVAQRPAMMEEPRTRYMEVRLQILEGILGSLRAFNGRRSSVNLNRRPRSASASPSSLLRPHDPSAASIATLSGGNLLDDADVPNSDRSETAGEIAYFLDNDLSSFLADLHKYLLYHRNANNAIFHDHLREAVPYLSSLLRPPDATRRPAPPAMPPPGGAAKLRARRLQPLGKPGGSGEIEITGRITVPRLSSTSKSDLPSQSSPPGGSFNESVYVFGARGLSSSILDSHV